MRILRRRTSRSITVLTFLGVSTAIPASAQTIPPQVPLSDSRCGYQEFSVPPCVVNGTRTLTDIGDTSVETPFGTLPLEVYRVDFDGQLQVAGAPQFNPDNPFFPSLPADAFFSTDQTVDVATSYTSDGQNFGPNMDPAYLGNFRDFDTTVRSIDVDLKGFIEGENDEDEEAGIGTRYAVRSIDPTAIVNGNSTALTGTFSQTGQAIVFGRINGTATLIENPGTTPTPQTDNGTPIATYYSPFALRYDVTAQETTRLDENGLVTPTISVTDGINMNGSRVSNLAAGLAAGDAVNVAQLNAEAAARTAADTQLTTAINSEATTRANADLQLSQRIQLEAEERAELAQSLQGETAARIAADNAMTGRLDAMSSRLDQVDSRLDRMEDYVAGSTAVAVAMTGNTFLPDTTFNLTANVGTYDGAHAGSVQFGAMVGPKMAVNAGVATGFNKRGKTAARAGVTFGW